MFACSLISQEISKRIPLRMNANSLDSNTETLLSQDVAVSLLQENKMALKRCELVRITTFYSDRVRVENLEKHGNLTTCFPDLEKVWK